MADYFHDRMSWRQDFGHPVILEPRVFIKTPTPKEILADIFALINEIQIDWLKRSLEHPEATA